MSCGCDLVFGASGFHSLFLSLTPADVCLPHYLLKSSACVNQPLMSINFILQFAVVYKARNNTDVSREDIIKTLASLVTQNGDYLHTVDLSNPDLTIVVEIIKVHVCMCIHVIIPITGVYWQQGFCEKNELWAAIICWLAFVVRK